MYTNRPGTAYDTIGLAGTSCFNGGLHCDFDWGSRDDTDQRCLIFWTVYVLDRQISLSCGKPYRIRDFHAAVEKALCDAYKARNILLPSLFDTETFAEVV